MGILSRKLGFQALSVEDPSQPWLPSSALFESLGLGRSDAGVLINEKQALRITTALACIKIISEDLATTSHEILQQMPDGSVRLAQDHRLWPILHDRPHPNMSASVFWGALVAMMLAWGNGYAWIKRDRSRRVVSLVPLEACKTSPIKREGKLWYGTTQTETGAVAYLDPEDVLHITYMTLDGITGISPISNCKNAFGLALAAEKFGAQFFGQGARATGVLTHPGVLEGEAYENLKKSLNERMTGENALRPMILEDGMDWKQITIPPGDAQFLQTRQHQDVNIARLYRVAMHLLQDLQRATNNNIEHQSLDHVRYCLRPNAVKIEEEVNFKLLGGPFVMEHNLKDMQRGDFASQTAGIQILRNIGYYSDNDIARELRQNPIPADQGGDIRVVQGAFINLTALLESGDGKEGGETATDAPDDTQPFDRITPAYRNLIEDAVKRVCRSGKGPEFAAKLMRPLVTSMLQALVALRFGTADLTENELAIVAVETGRISSEASSWDANEAPAIAVRIAGELYRGLRKELA